MKILVDRIYRGPSYTISHIYIDGKYVCDGLEDVDRGLKQDDDLAVISARKIKGRTAIPTGIYKLSMGIVSSRFSKIQYYVKFCGGYMPRVLNVPGFDGILIHPGNTAEDTEGCLLVGQNKEKGKVINSKTVWESIMKSYLLPAKKKGEDIIIEYR